MHDVVFNELSFQPFPADFKALQVRINIFVELLKSLQSNYEVQKVVFGQELDKYQTMADGTTLLQYLADNRVSHTQKGLLFGLRKHPFYEEENEPQVMEYIGSNFSANTPTGKMPCDGLGIAFLYDKLAVSLVSDVFWENMRIEIAITTDTETVTRQVLNISKPEHLAGETDITRWIVANVQASIAVVEDLKTLYPHYVFENQAFEDLMYWKENDTQIYEKVHTLLKDIELNPFRNGLGQTEVLKHLKDKASKRINQEHRMTYWVEGKDANKKITIYRCKGHY
jgi:toxin YoeB